MANDLEAQPTWTGWYRRRKGSPWRAVAQAENEAGCWDQLLAAVHDSGETIVLPSHRHPDGGREKAGLLRRD